MGMYLKKDGWCPIVVLHSYETHEVLDQNH